MSSSFSNTASSSVVNSLEKFPSTNTCHNSNFTNEVYFDPMQEYTEASDFSFVPTDTHSGSIDGMFSEAAPPCSVDFSTNGLQSTTPAPLYYSAPFNIHMGKFFQPQLYNPADNISVSQFVKPSIEYYTPTSTPALEPPNTPQSMNRIASASPFSVTPDSYAASESWIQVPASGPFAVSSAGIDTAVSPENDNPVWWNHAGTTPLAQPSPTYSTFPQRPSKSYIAKQLQNDLNHNDGNMDLGMTGMTGNFVSHMSATLKYQHDFKRDMSASPAHGLGHMIPPQLRHSMSPYIPHMNEPYLLPQSQLRSSSYTPSYASPSPSPSPFLQHTSQHTLAIRNIPHNYVRSSPYPSPSATIQSNLRAASSSPLASRVQKRKYTTKNNAWKNNQLAAVNVSEFLNYTASDSTELLSGVAPSGSSKTKARREKEALEKRRKLGRAAVRAVREAGGDVESLVEEVEQLI